MKATIYRDKNYQHGVELPEGWYNAGVLEAFGFHDAISSVRVPPGMVVRLYKDKDLTGGCLTLDSDAPDLGSWNDRASSIEVTSGDTTPRPVVFENPDYRGPRMYLEPGCYAYGDVNANVWVGNDRITSAQVPEGFLVALFEHSGYKGRVCGLTSDIRDLAQLDFDNRTSNILVYPEAWFAPQLRHGPPPVIPKLTGYDFHYLPPQTEQRLVAEALVPFHFVHDPQLVPNVQAQESAYYRLGREEVWEMVLGYHHPGVAAYKYSKRVKTGMSKSETNTVKQTVSVEITSSGGLGFKLDDIGFDLRVSSKVAQQLETTFSTTDTLMEEKEVEIVYDFPAVECTVVLWMRRDVYVLRRWDCDLVANWSFLQDSFVYGEGWPASQPGGQPLNLHPTLLRVG